MTVLTRQEFDRYEQEGGEENATPDTRVTAEPQGGKVSLNMILSFLFNPHQMPLHVMESRFEIAFSKFHVSEGRRTALPTPTRVFSPPFTLNRTQLIDLTLSSGEPFMDSVVEAPVCGFSPFQGSVAFR